MFCMPGTGAGGQPCGYTQLLPIESGSSWGQNQVTLNIELDPTWSPPGLYTVFVVPDYWVAWSYFLNPSTSTVEVDAPTVFVTGPVGVPQGGSDTFTVFYTGLGDDTITLSLKTAGNGTGTATFDGGATTMTITFQGNPLQQQHQNVRVYGAQASTNANDVTISASDYSGTLNSQQFSVVWVSISLVATGAPVQNDLQAVDFLQFINGPDNTGGQPGLGAELYFNYSANPFSCSVGVELVGTVTPANYPGLVTLNRNIVGTAVFRGQTEQPNLEKPPGADNSAASLVDNVVGQGQPGKVFDLDPPGVGAFSGSPGRYRTNFQEYAVLGDADSTEQASLLFPYAVAVSCGGTLDAPMLDGTYLGSGDNAAIGGILIGTTYVGGTIYLTYNLGGQ
jgi:hypothetical protein